MLHLFILYFFWCCLRWLDFFLIMLHLFGGRLSWKMKMCSYYPWRGCIRSIQVWKLSWQSFYALTLLSAQAVHLPPKSRSPRWFRSCGPSSRTCILVVKLIWLEKNWIHIWSGTAVHQICSVLTFLEFRTSCFLLCFRFPNISRKFFSLFLVLPSASLLPWYFSSIPHYLTHFHYKGILTHRHCLYSHLLYQITAVTELAWDDEAVVEKFDKTWPNICIESPQLLASILLLNYIQTIPSFPPHGNRHKLLQTSFPHNHIWHNQSFSTRQSQTLRKTIC